MLTQEQGRAENLPGRRPLTRAKSSITVPLSCARHWPYQAPGWQLGTGPTLNLLLRSFSDPWQYALPQLLKDLESLSRGQGPGRAVYALARSLFPEHSPAS